MFSSTDFFRMHRMLRALSVILPLLAPGLAAPAASASTPQNHSPDGLWLTANGHAVVRVTPCGGDICGQIAGLVLAPNEKEPLSWNGVPQCGLTIFRTAPVDKSAAQPAAWSGTILDPRNGAHYGARIMVDPQGALRLRGYVAVPLFGQTQTWTRYKGTVPADCRLVRTGQ